MNYADARAVRPYLPLILTHPFMKYVFDLVLASRGGAEFFSFNKLAERFFECAEGILELAEGILEGAEKRLLRTL